MLIISLWNRLVRRLWQVDCLSLFDGPVAQLAEQATLNRLVRRSIRLGVIAEDLIRARATKRATRSFCFLLPIPAAGQPRYTQVNQEQRTRNSE